MTANYRQDQPLKSIQKEMIVFENESFIALNKPAGMLSIPDREQTQTSLKDLLIDRFGQIFTVHRLDRETSGLILFAKNETGHKYFSKQFEDRSMEKYYVGLVHGTPASAEGMIDAPIMEHPVNKGQMVIHAKGKPSQTGYKVLESFGKYSLVEFRLYTGRTHQIRLHAKQIGHPLVCDPLYGDGKPLLLSSIKRNYKLSKHDETEKPMIDRVALHAYRLQFTDSDGKNHNLTAELPKDIRATVQQLKKQGH